MKVRLTAFVLLFALVVSSLISPLSASAKPATVNLVLPVTLVLPDEGTLTGTVSDLTFSVNEAGKLVVGGVLSYPALVGGVLTTVEQAFSLVATLTNGGTAKCDILFLDLGPIFLDLLGLQVDISPITIDIDAIPGAGNLLGNLLCALVGLLDAGGPLSDLLDILKQLNRIVV